MGSDHTDRLPTLWKPKCNYISSLLSARLNQNKDLTSAGLRENDEKFPVKHSVI